MQKNFTKIIKGYEAFRKKYAVGDASVMQSLSYHGQKPRIMMVSCCDSRVDPALILQCDPGDLFIVRNVANIVPPYEKDEAHHGTSAALEFGIRVLKIKDLILLGHSQCGGIQALFNKNVYNVNADDFITNWVSLIKTDMQPEGALLEHTKNADDYAKLALQQSYQHCLTFPWINDAMIHNKLCIHLWFFDIKMGQIFTYSTSTKTYEPLDGGDFNNTHKAPVPPS